MKRGVISAEEERGSPGYPADIHRRDLEHFAPVCDSDLKDLNMLWIIFRIGHCDPEDVDLNDLLLPEQGRRRRYHPTSPHRQTCSQVQGWEFIKEKK